MVLSMFLLLCFSVSHTQPAKLKTQLTISFFASLAVNYNCGDSQQTLKKWAQIKLIEIHQSQLTGVTF